MSFSRFGCTCYIVHRMKTEWAESERQETANTPSRSFRSAQPIVVPVVQANSQLRILRFVSPALAFACLSAVFESVFDVSRLREIVKAFRIPFGHQQRFRGCGAGLNFFHRL